MGFYAAGELGSFCQFSTFDPHAPLRYAPGVAWGLPRWVRFAKIHLRKNEPVVARGAGWFSRTRGDRLPHGVKRSRIAGVATEPVVMPANAIILTAGLLNTSDTKTAHGLIRQSERYTIVGVVDPPTAGRDAGEVLDGKPRGIPVFSTIADALVAKPQYCIVGVATVGGVFPDAVLADVRTAIANGLSVVNGLHDYLSDRPDIARLAADRGVELIDIRKPKPRKDLHFWTGKVRELSVPIIAVLGTDCALGKRTTCRSLTNACKDAGVHAEMIYTGQTGWMQGGKYGFIFDSTLNDFVTGELEHAILTCAAETKPDVILIEGQAALRNPSGPCGSEFLVSGNACKVILVHAPKRKFYDHNPAWGPIASLASEVQLIELYGAKVIAIALNTEHCTPDEASAYQRQYAAEMNVPVVLPLQDGCASLVPLMTQRAEPNA